MSLLKKYSNIKNQELEKIYFEFNENIEKFILYILENGYTINDFLDFYKYEGFDFYLDLNSSSSIRSIKLVKEKSNLSYGEVFNILDVYYDLDNLNNLLDIFGVDPLLNASANDSNIYNIYDFYKKIQVTN